VTNLDALVIKIRDGNAVRNCACYLAIGVNLEGERDVLGIWFRRTEGAKFWLAVLTELKQRGVQDGSSAASTGSRGFRRRSRPSSPAPGCRPAWCT
jgi:putative transposase